MFDVNLLFVILLIFFVNSSFFVVICNHPVFSLLFLMSNFIIVSFIFFLIECEILGFYLIVLYSTAVLILLLFCCLMLESKLNNLLKNNFKYIPVGFILCLFLLIPLMHEIFIHSSSDIPSKLLLNWYQNWYKLIAYLRDIGIYAQILYSYFLFEFLLFGLIILSVLIGVVYLTKKIYIKSRNKIQSLFKQLARKFKIF